MKVSYFGGVGSGKNHIIEEYIHNTKSICLVYHNKTIKLITTKLENNNILCKETIICSDIEHEHISKIDLSDPEIFSRAPIDRWKDNFSLTEEVFKKVNKAIKARTILPRLRDRADVSLYNYKKYCKEITSSDLFLPHYDWNLIDTLDCKHIPEDIGERFSVVPYKENLEDSFICKLNIIKNIESCSKAEIFSKLNTIILGSRKLELLLQKANINYEYFNLDVDSYEKLGIKETLDKKWSHYSSWAGINRYEYLKDLAQEYIFESNIKDTRLCGVKFDGLKPL